jgi:KDO2-lipid IV(A) lauroyltransferase
MKLIGVKDIYFLSVITVIQVVSWLPSYRLKNSLVHLIAYSAYYLSSRKRRLSEQSVAKAFDGKLTQRQIRAVVKRSFYEFWCDTFAMLPSKTERLAIRQAHLHGKQHLQRALDNGKGAILWVSNHFGRMTLSKQIMRENGFAVHKVHIEDHLGGFQNDGAPTWVQHRIIRPFFERCERAVIAGTIYLPKSDSLAFTRTFQERLKENAIVCAAGDAKSGKKFIPVKFLWLTDYFPTGLVSLAKLSGAAMLPLFCVQETGDRTSIIIESPISIDRDDDRERCLEKAVTQYVRLLESYIKTYPEQYRNWHELTKLNSPDTAPISSGR